MAFKGFSYYWGAIASTKCISAVLFVFLPGKDGDSVTLDTCTGWVRHRGRFFESKAHTFELDAWLTEGDVEVLLLDQNKQPLLKLTRQFPTRTLYLDSCRRYFLHWKFQNASGKCALRW